MIMLNKITTEQKQTMQQENEKKKAYLQSYKKYKQTARRLEEQLKELRLNEMFPSLMMSDMPSSHNQKDMSDYIVKYDELLSEIIRLRHDAIQRFKEIRQQIELLENENEKTVLTLRYLRNYTWEKICVEMNYSWMQTHRFHARALQNFEIKKMI